MNRFANRFAAAFSDNLHTPRQRFYNCGLPVAQSSFFPLQLPREKMLTLVLGAEVRGIRGSGIGVRAECLLPTAFRLLPTAHWGRGSGGWVLEAGGWGRPKVALRVSARFQGPVRGVLDRRLRLGRHSGVEPWAWNEVGRCFSPAPGTQSPAPFTPCFAIMLLIKKAVSGIRNGSCKNTSY
jgi:hypothetical protein